MLNNKVGGYEWYCLKWEFSNNTRSYLFGGLWGFAIVGGDQRSEGWEDRNEIHAHSSELLVPLFYLTALSRKSYVQCFPTP